MKKKFKVSDVIVTGKGGVEGERAVGEGGVYLLANLSGFIPLRERVELSNMSCLRRNLCKQCFIADNFLLFCNIL